ncbi:MAG: hypothetical protein ACLFOY_16695 [Desulfatibacillaceae bacterium]
MVDIFRYVARGLIIFTMVLSLGTLVYMAIPSFADKYDDKARGTIRYACVVALVCGVLIFALKRF